MTEPEVHAHGKLELDFDDPVVREELRVIVNAVARLIAHSKSRVKNSKAYDCGLSISERRKSRNKIH
mgnify:CR=1 FL=1